MLKTFFVAATTSAVFIATPVSADLGNPEDFKKPMAPSFAFVTFGQKGCEGYGLGISKQDILLNTYRGTHYIPYDIADEGRIMVYPTEAKYIACPA